MEGSQKSHMMQSTRGPGLPSEQVTCRKVSRAALALLPEELLEIITSNLEEELWPPVESAITDWDNYPSSAAQRNLCSLSLVCQKLNRIVAPRLWRNIVHDFNRKTSHESASSGDTYRWLSVDSFSLDLIPQWIRVLYLYDSFQDLDPALKAGNMAQLLQKLAGSLEVLVTKGFCATVLLHTLNTRQLGEMGALKVLKVYSHTITVKAMHTAFYTFPNLTSITVDAVNIEGVYDESSRTMAHKLLNISQLDICMRLYAPEEYEALRQILRPLIPTLKMVHIHGEFHDDLNSVVSLLKLSPIEILLINFRNRFPESLMSLRLPTLKSLAISTYAHTSPKFWECDLLQSVSSVICRTSGYPLDARHLDQRIKAPNLKLLELQSLCYNGDQEEEGKWDSAMREWCLRRGISFINGNSYNNIIRPVDDCRYV